MELIGWLVGNPAVGDVFAYMFTSLCWGSFPCNIEVPYWATLRFPTRQHWSSLSSNTAVSYKVALDLFTWQHWGFFIKQCWSSLPRFLARQHWGCLPGNVEVSYKAALRLFSWQRRGSLPGSVEVPYRQCWSSLPYVHSLPGPIHIVCSNSSIALLSLLVTQRWNTPQTCNQTTSTLLHTCSVSALKYNINPPTYY